MSKMDEDLRQVSLTLRTILQGHAVRQALSSIVVQRLVAVHDGQHVPANVTPEEGEEIMAEGRE